MASIIILKYSQFDVLQNASIVCNIDQSHFNGLFYACNKNNENWTLNHLYLTNHVCEI